MSNYDKSILDDQNIIDNMPGNDDADYPVYLVVTDDTEVVFSSDDKAEAYISYDCESVWKYYNKSLKLKKIPYTDFINGKDKHNIQNSTLIEFKEL